MLEPYIHYIHLWAAGPGNLIDTGYILMFDRRLLKMELFSIIAYADAARPCNFLSKIPQPSGADVGH